jgi:hypothetical protein
VKLTLKTSFQLVAFENKKEKTINAPLKPSLKTQNCVAMQPKRQDNG